MSNLTYKKRSVLILGALLLIGVGGLLNLRVQKPSAPAQRHVVEILDLTFKPASLVVAPGDTIVWINRDVVPHTATAIGGNAHWDSGTLQEADSWYLVVQEGEPQSYYCRFHPAMQGSFVVKTERAGTAGTVCGGCPPYALSHYSAGTQVEWFFDYDHREWGTRRYHQIAVQRWRGGLIIHERFYYGA